MRHALAVATIACLVVASGKAQDGPYHFAKEIAIGGDGRVGLSLGRPGGAPPLRQPRDQHRRHRYAGWQGRRRNSRHARCPRLRDRGRSRARLLEQRPREQGRHRRPEDARSSIQKVDTGENPDAILYEPARKEVYAFNGRGKSATVIDAQTGKVVATIPARGQARVRPGRLEGRQGLRQHGGPERHQGHRHRDAQGDRDVADRAGRGGDRHGDRRGEPPAVHRLRQQADAHGRQHERQDDLQRAGRRWRRFHLVRPGQQAGVHLGRRIGHGHRRARGVAHCS